MPKKILAVDDDSTFSLMIQAYLNKNGFEVSLAGNVHAALESIRKSPPDLVLSDYRMPGKDGMEMLEEIQKTNPGLPLVLMTGFGDIRLAVRAMKAGARDYLTKPVNPSELLEVVKNILDTDARPAAAAVQAAVNRVPAGKSVSPSYTQDGFVHGVSANWKQINEHIDLVAPTPLSVIILGESGTGKEFVARRLHDLSVRAGEPFVAIDCGTLSGEIAASEFFGHVKGSFTGAVTDKTGQFEAANGGTVFLDEIGNLSYEVQIMLLRAIQERKIRKVGSVKDIPVDVRIIAATNEDLTNGIRRGSFREDLYHRLNEFSIRVEPLRNRKDDLPLFAGSFLELANAELGKHVKGFSREVMQKFMEYPWPGNLREFKNVIKRSVLLSRSDMVELNALPSELRSEHFEIPVENTVDLKVISEDIEKKKIVEALEKVKYNKSKAAQMLNIDRKTLYNKIRLYGLDA
ncbi:MAG: sigma-54-dependent Fis family transcriptional regulator [Bacteroidia bacterium]|nr:sigma-54-dependent Fis family transcriptional regulator [Bacteroidia bacterium]